VPPPPEANDDARARNRALFDGPFGRVYAYYTARPWLSRLIARVVWGGDIRPFYASLAEIARVPDGGLIERPLRRGCLRIRYDHRPLRLLRDACLSPSREARGGRLVEGDPLDSWPTRLRRSGQSRFWPI
jgi:hypothetical protein